MAERPKHDETTDVASEIGYYGELAGWWTQERSVEYERPGSGSGSHYLRIRQ